MINGLISMDQSFEVCSLCPSTKDANCLSTDLRISSLLKVTISHFRLLKRDMTSIFKVQFKRI